MGYNRRMNDATIKPLNSAERLVERLAPGVTFVYVSNTLHEKQRPNARWLGRQMTVKRGKWVKDLDVEGMTDGFRMEVPKSAASVEWIDADTVRYAIVGAPVHTVTLRFLEGSMVTPCANCGEGVIDSEGWVHEANGVVECDTARLAERGYPDEGYAACPEHYENGSIVTRPRAGGA